MYNLNKWKERHWNKFLLITRASILGLIVMPLIYTIMKRVEWIIYAQEGQCFDNGIPQLILLWILYYCGRKYVKKKHLFMQNELIIYIIFYICFICGTKELMFSLHFVFLHKRRVETIKCELVQNSTNEYNWNEFPLIPRASIIGL